MDLNDRERSSSPGPSPLLERKYIALESADVNRPKQWRLKIEEWLQENEKEQERERKLRDKIALERLKRQEMEQREPEVFPSVDDKSDDWKSGKNLATLHEVKTDSEIYTNKVKNDKQNDSLVKSPEMAESIPLKDKSKWRKSNLNVANSSESINDERRRSRSRKTVSDPDIDDTISFYIRSNDTQSCEKIMPYDKKEAMLPNYGQPNKQIEDMPNITSSSTTYPVLATSMDVNTNSLNDILKQKEGSNAKSELNIPKEEKTEIDPGVLIGRSRFYHSMREPSFHTTEQKFHRSAASDDELLDTKDYSKSRKDGKIKIADDEELKNTSSEKDEEGNFDRFSYMRKTTRRMKSRNKLQENETKKSDDVLNEEIKNGSKNLPFERNPKDSTFQKTENVKENNSDDSNFMEAALKEINQSSKEIQNLCDDKGKIPGGIFTKYASDNVKVQENGDEQKKKEKHSSLKARLSKRLLSLTENLKVVAKPSDPVDPSSMQPVTEDKKTSVISECPCPSIEKVLNERRASLKEEMPNPIMEHREKVLAQPIQDIVQNLVKHKLPQTPSDYNPIVISKPQFFKEGYTADTNNVKIIHATPIIHDVKELEAYPVTKGKEECEKDEGFEETQSQLSEAASQGAGSNYDTDLADSPRSVRQAKDSNAVKVTTLPQNAETKLSQKIKDKDKKSIDEIPVVIPSEKVEKLTLPKNYVSSSSNMNRNQSMKRGVQGRTQERIRSSLSNSERLQNSEVGADKKNPQQTLSTLKNSSENKNCTRPVTTNLHSNLRSSQDSVSSAGSRTIKKQILRGLGNMNETSPKIGRRVAAYTKAIKSMTSNLRASKKFENYDVTQSMPPTPSEEKKTFVSGLNLSERGKKARSSSSVYSPRLQSRRSSEKSINFNIGVSSRRESEKSLSSKRSSDRSLDLSRKSSEASVVTVKSASRKAPVPTSRHSKPVTPVSHRLATTNRTKAKPINTKTSVQIKQFRVPSKAVTRSNSDKKQVSPTVRPNTVVRRTSSNRSSCSFMKATSASSAKTTPTKLPQEQNKLKIQGSERTTSKPITVAKFESSVNKIKQRY